MASGGYRAGAGRPRKPDYALSRPRSTKAKAKNDIPTPDVPAEMTSLTPIEYALQVMNDPREAKERRDRLCIALLPYFHAKPSELGKKDQAEKNAKVLSEKGKFKASVVPINSR